MKRQELEKKAYDIIRSDMSYIGTSDQEIREEIKKASDEELYSFINE